MISTYCIIENADCVVTVRTYPYTEEGLAEAQKDFLALCRDRELHEDVEFNLDPTNVDDIANVTNTDDDWDLVLTRSLKPKKKK
jgi:hypothetical protein